MNREDEKLCLKWNDFQENAITAFKTLREDREFVDVTLACEDGQQLEAHKIILATSSPFFLNLLKRNKHPHPIIYMKGLKSEDLMTMVDFLYYGEAKCYQENLVTFFAMAEELKLKGLMGSDTDAEGKPNKSQPKKESHKKLATQKENHQENNLPNIFTPVTKVETEALEGTEVATDFIATADLQDIDNKVKSMMKTSENRMKGKEGRARICKVCGKEGPMRDIMNHIEVHHITGVSHPCNICGKSSRSRPALKMHKTTYHNMRPTSHQKKSTNK